jgi:serine/threonine-protein kinase RsbW
LQFEIIFDAEVRAISPVVDGVMKIVTDMGCAAGKEYEVETALREALANAIVHGCGGDRSKQVHCSVACEEDGSMGIVVRDPGPGFDPDSLPSPTGGKQIYSNHGRGVYLINQLMDEVRYERGGAEIHMWKY